MAKSLHKSKDLSGWEDYLNSISPKTGQYLICQKQRVVYIMSMEMRLETQQLNTQLVFRLITIFIRYRFVYLTIRPESILGEMLAKDG